MADILQTSFEMNFIDTKKVCLCFEFQQSCVFEGGSCVDSAWEMSLVFSFFSKEI